LVHLDEDRIGQGDGRIDGGWASGGILDVCLDQLYLRGELRHTEFTNVTQRQGDLFPQAGLYLEREAEGEADQRENDVRPWVGGGYCYKFGERKVHFIFS
jgi:hypothetical protein